jgi:hypothetical protein
MLPQRAGPCVWTKQRMCLQVRAKCAMIEFDQNSIRGNL